MKVNDLLLHGKDISNGNSVISREVILYKMSNVAFFVIVSLIMTTGLYGQSSGLPFLKLGVGAHAQSMGGAFMAQSRDASSVYWNPSALAYLKGNELFLYHSELVSDLQYHYVSYGQPLKTSKSAIGLAFGYLSKGIQERRDENRNLTGDFGASDSLLTFAYSKIMGKRHSLGIGFHLLRSKIGTFSSRGFAIDFSETVQLSSKSRLAFGIYHLGGKMKFKNDSFSLPSTLAAGLSHRFTKALTINADSRYEMNDQKYSFSLGGELSLAKLVSFRMGYLSQLAKQGTTNNSFSGVGKYSGIGLGLGFKLFRKSTLDYAFTPMGELGGTHHMNLTWRFK